MKFPSARVKAILGFTHPRDKNHDDRVRAIVLLRLHKSVQSRGRAHINDRDTIVGPFRVFTYFLDKVPKYVFELPGNLIKVVVFS